MSHSVECDERILTNIRDKGREESSIVNTRRNYFFFQIKVKHM